MRRLLPNLILALVATLIALLAVELMARQMFSPPAGPATYREPHPTLGWRLVPDVAYSYDTGERTVRVAYNSRGYRDVEHRLAKPAGTYRVVVLGDSFMEAYTVELRESFTRQLEAKAREAGYRDIEVINLGVGGYGTLQAYLTFIEEGILYEPDLVLLAFYAGNDPRSNYLPLERVTVGGLKVEARPFLDPNFPGEWVITQVDYERARADYDAAITRRLAQEDNALQLEGIARLIEAIQQQQAVRSQGEAWIATATDTWMGASLCNETPDWTAAWDITEQILIRLNDEVSADGADFAVFTVPAMYELEADYRQRVEDELSDPSAYCIEQAPGNIRLGSIAASHDIPFFDLLPAFQSEYAANGGPLFDLADRHWNAAGHNLAAESVLTFLQAEAMLP